MSKIKKEYVFIAILLVSFIILTFFVSAGFLNNVDKAFFDKIIFIKSNVITNSLYVITNLASSLGVLVTLIITAFIFIKRKVFSDFKYVIINVSIGVILMQVIKSIIKRVRPAWKWIKQGGFSYPSGHTICALLLYGTLMLLINKRIKGKPKKVLMIVFSIMIILTAISRIYFGAHYFTDVFASFILGDIILIISNMIMNEEFSNDKNKIR